LRAEQAYLSGSASTSALAECDIPRQLDGLAVQGFLSRLAVDDFIAANTQDQAPSALLFFYREVLAIELPGMENYVRANRTARPPVVLSRNKVAVLLARVGGHDGLTARLLYASRLRLMECLGLRIKDVDFQCGELIVRDGRYRKTVLQASLRAALGVPGR